MNLRSVVNFKFWELEQHDTIVYYNWVCVLEFHHLHCIIEMNISFDADEINSQVSKYFISDFKIINYKFIKLVIFFLLLMIREYLKPVKPIEVLWVSFRVLHIPIEVHWLNPAILHNFTNHTSEVH